MIKRILLLIVVLAFALPALAQDSGGQFWVQAFEDRNSSGAHDPGEPFLTRGVTVDLLNADGVVMASGTLDDAPFASRGFIGFLYLAPGNYTAVIRSPDLTPTTPDQVEVTITQGTAPVTVMFGAQRAALSEAADSSGSSLLNGELARIALAGFGAAVVVGVMAMLGGVIYLLVLRRRAPAAVRRTTTGSMRPVPLNQTGEISPHDENRQTVERNKR